MISSNDLLLLYNEMWQLTYEEVQQVHQMLVAEWIFDNCNAQVEVTMKKALNFVRQRQLERNNRSNVRVTDGERLVLRDDISGWKGLERILEQMGVTINVIGDGIP